MSPMTVFLIAFGVATLVGWLRGRALVAQAAPDARARVVSVEPDRGRDRDRVVALDRAA